MTVSLITGFIAKAYKQLPEVMPGFKPRPQQQQMIKRACALFTREAVGMVEATTGTGKSMGYLLPGIVVAGLQDRRLIISTATASLQDQLATKDLPAVINAVKGIEHEGVHIAGIDVAVAKGRERYVCPVRLHEQVANGENLFADENERKESEQVIRLYKRHESGEWDGVRDSMTEPVSQKTWRSIANTAVSCTGRQCPEYEVCPYYGVQEKLKTARVIVTNHDYLLTCLSRVPNSPLSDPKAIYIFDEGHHLGDKLIGAFARRLDFGRTFKEDVTAALAFAGADFDSLDLSFERIQGGWNACTHSIATMLGDGTLHRFSLGQAPTQFLELLTTLSGDIRQFQDRLTNTRDRIKQREAGKNLPGVMSLAEIRFNKLLADLDEAQVSIEDFTNDDNLARWLERGRNTLEICCSPFDPAEKARKHLWPVVKSGLITSATLASLGSFAPTLFGLGLDGNTPTLKLTSPLDYSKARIYVPAQALDGNDSGHGRRVAAYLKALRREDLGVLVYFTSRKLMQECYEAMPEHERELVLLQGQWQPSMMIAEHKRRIDAGQRSVIFGLDSVAEGIDLPGNYCTLVVVTKLPFPLINDPILNTHGEFLKEEGKDPFNLLTLPLAGRKFAQVCGRLMRREGDHGDVMVLDRRLISKRYGKRLMAGMPFEGLSSH